MYHPRFVALHWKINPFKPSTLNGYTSKCLAYYWSNRPFSIFWHSGTLALRTEHQTARMSKNWARLVLGWVTMSGVQENLSHYESVNSRTRQKDKRETDYIQLSKTYSVYSICTVTATQVNSAWPSFFRFLSVSQRLIVSSAVNFVRRSVL